MNQKLLALYGLKWNPFSPGLPVEALLTSAKIDSFCWRVENSLVREGGAIAHVLSSRIADSKRLVC